MRLLNIKNGILETKNMEDVKDEYVAISHRWLENEINLSDLGLFNLGNTINLGEKLYDDLYLKIIKCSTVVNIIQTPDNKNDDIENIKWNNYLNFFKNNKDINKEKFNNHHKLIKIINCMFKKYEIFIYIWLDTLCIDKTSSSELSENIISMYNIYKMQIISMFL